LETNLDRCQELCDQAVTEKDTKKLAELTTEICRLLDDKKKPVPDLPTPPDAV